MQGDIILVGLRDYQDEKADVILKCAPMLLQPLSMLCFSSCTLHGSWVSATIAS